MISPRSRPCSAHFMHSNKNSSSGIVYRHTTQRDKSWHISALEELQYRRCLLSVESVRVCLGQARIIYHVCLSSRSRLCLLQDFLCIVAIIPTETNEGLNRRRTHLLTHPLFFLKANAIKVLRHPFPAVSKILEPGLLQAFQPNTSTLAHPDEP